MVLSLIPLNALTASKLDVLVLVHNIAGYNF